MKTYNHFINNEYVEPLDGEWMDTVNPYTGKAWARVPKGSAKDVDRAVQAARQAMTTGPYARMTPTERGKMMLRLADLVAANAQRLAEIEVRDNGKLLSEMRGQLNYHPEWWRYFGGLADKLEGGVVPIDKPEHFAFTTQEPVGVVGALTAWNSPLLFIAWKCAPAIAAGCSIVVKPSEFTSASTLEFAALTKEAGFPDGVFNVVAGLGPTVGAALVEHPDVAKITFTGSDATGAAIYAQAAKTMKRVTLELGGKSPNIVFADADLDKAAAGVISGIFAATGQTCMAGSRLMLQESIHDEFVERLIAIASKARLGDPSLPDVQMGPVATRPQFDKIMHYIGVAKDEGARCVFGGKARTGEGYGAGQFVEPTIFVDVHNGMRIAQEEVFGPVLSVIRFKDEEDAIRIANDIRFGLAAGVWTRSLHRAMLMSQRVKAGTVWVNNYRSTSYTTPFGGYKDSGIGREGGIEAVKEYLETKSVWISSDLDMPDPFIRKY